MTVLRQIIFVSASFGALLAQDGRGVGVAPNSPPLGGHLAQTTVPRATFAPFAPNQNGHLAQVLAHFWRTFGATQPPSSLCSSDQAVREYWSAA